MLQKLLIAMGVLALSACGGSLDLGPKNPPPVVETPACEIIEGQLITYSFDNQEAVDEWYVNGDGINIRIDYDITESAILIIPEDWVDGEADYLRQARVNLDDVTNLSGAEITVVFDLPAAYKQDGGLVMELVLQGEGVYTNPRRSTAADNDTALVAGENTWVWTVGAAATAENFSIGLPSFPNDHTIREAIVVRSVAIQQADEEICPDDEEPSFTTLDVDMTSANWTVLDIDEADVSVEHMENGVAYTPTETDQKLVYLLDGPVDLSGSSFTIEFSVEQALVDAEAYIQPFAQQNFGSYDGHWSCSVGNTALLVGEPNSYTCEPLPGTINAEEGENLRIGLQVKGATAGTIIIHSLSIAIPEE